MTLLAPWTALAAAAVAVPLLLVLYFLKLRRRRLRLPATFLWPHLADDLQVNTPFRRLKLSLLLLLQLGALGLLLGALARPVSESGGAPAARVVLLIDRSASMQATVDASGRTRFDAALDTARSTVRRLARRSERTTMMIVSFAATARIECGDESRPAVLLDALDRIAPTDGPARLEPALRLADAAVRSTDEDAADRAEVVLLSDGGVEPPRSGAGFGLAGARFRFVRVGGDAAPDNVGIVAFSARRDFERAERVLVFARVVNCGTEPVRTVLDLRADDAPGDLRTVDVPAAGPDGPGEATATFELVVEDAAVLALRQHHADALAVDDVAWLDLAPPGRPRIGLVHGGDAPDRFLEGVLRSLDPRRLDVVPLDRYRREMPGGVGAAARYDLLVFDRADGVRLPPVPSLHFGGAPAGVDAVAGDAESGRRLVSWRRQDPILRHASLDELVWSGFTAFVLPGEAEALARGADGPVIARVRAAGVDHVLVGFALDRSTWPVDVSFAVFVQNVVERLAPGGGEGVTFAPGAAIELRPAPGAERIEIDGPASFTVEVRDGAPVVAPRLERTGVYVLRGVLPAQRTIAVSLLEERESDLRPVERLVVNARDVEGAAVGAAAPREWWPWLVGAAAVLLLVEWIVYALRMGGGGR